MDVSVRELKNKLSEYLVRVRAGERLVVTLRGRPIAEVGPARRGRLSPEEELKRLAEAGEIRLPKGAGLADLEPVRVRGPSVSRTLLDERG